MTKSKKYIKLFFFLFVIATFISNNLICYANDIYLDDSFWNSIQNSEKTITQSHYGNSIKIKYNCSTSENGRIGLYIDIGKSSFIDSLESLHPNISYYIHNNNQDVSAILNYDSTIQSNNIDLIKDYGINFSTYNNSYKLLSFIKTNKLDKNSYISAYLTIENCRYKILDKVELHNYLYENPSETISDDNNFNHTTKKNKPEESNKDKTKETTSAKSKYQNQKENNKKENSTNSNTNNKKYSNDSSNNNLLNEEHSNSETESSQEINNTTQASEFVPNSSRLSNASKIALFSGAVIAIIGFTVITTSMIFYNSSKKSD